MIGRIGVLMLVTVLGVPSEVIAQDPPRAGARAAQLREMIETRFAERLATELGLDTERSERVRDVLIEWAGKRRALEREEQRVRQRLGAAMRPGVAADEAEVTRLIEALLTGRAAYVATFRDELTDLAPILTAVQRAQYVLMRDRLMQRVQDVRNQRAGSPPGAQRNRPPR